VRGPGDVGAGVAVDTFEAAIEDPTESTDRGTPGDTTGEAAEDPEGTVPSLSDGRALSAGAAGVTAPRSSRGVEADSR
jgi:hypothetical protein